MRKGDVLRLPEGWEIKKLGECGLVQTGTTPKTSEKENYGNYIQFAKPPHFKRNGQINTNESYLSKIGMGKSRVFPPNSVLMVCIGTIGKTGFSDKSITSNQQINGLTPSDEYYPRFFYYLFISEYVQKQIMSIGKSAQATLPIINKTKWSNINLALPKSIEEQKRIVSILDRAFEAIDKAKANAEQNLNNAKELFESYLQGVFENKGDDWEEKSIAEIVGDGILDKPLDGNHGETHPTKSDFKESGVPFIMASHIVDGLVNQKTCHFISKDQADSLRKGFSVNGDVLLTHKGTIGRVAILKTDLDYVMLTPQVTYYRILDREILNNRYLFYYFQSSIFQKPMNKIAGVGSTRAYIGITKQRELKIRFPNNLNLQKQIVNKLDALSAETKKLEAIYQQKIDNLEELKKSVLQKAFRGKL